MNVSEVQEKLNMLAELEKSYALSKADWEASTAEAKEKIDDLRAEITEAVLIFGETVKTETMSAIWNKGKTSWDGKLLEGYALAHPDVLAA